MEAETATRPGATTAGDHDEAIKPAGPRTPWWMWLAVAAIVVFCLFPFYWLINMSLKTGADLGGELADPAEPDAGQLQVDLPEPRLRAGARQQRDRRVDHDGARRSRSARSARTRCAPAVQGQVHDPRARPVDHDVPAIAIAAPLFKLWSDIGLFNTLIGLIIPYLTFALPLTIYILVSFFKEIPKDLEEAALVDGATHFQAFRKVVVPLAAPGPRHRGDPDVHRGVERVPARRSR